jgi:transposase-like protein
MECKYCKGQCKKAGKYKSIQRYQCKTCKRYQQESYTRERIPQEKYDGVCWLNNEGNGISSIARLLAISKSSVQRTIIRIASALKMPVCQETGQCYQVDELRIYCGNKGEECWVI